MGEQSTYNYIDIQRYLQQQMTPQEMHAFEKAMLADPFLADAMEGYTHADNALSAEHLTTIEQEIRGTDEQAKVVALPKRNTTWFKVAAIILVILAGTILTYQLSRKSITSAPAVAANSKMTAPVVADSIQAAEPLHDLANNNTKLKSMLPPQQKATTPYMDNDLVAQVDDAKQKGTSDTTLIVMQSPTIANELMYKKEKTAEREAKAAATASATTLQRDAMMAAPPAATNEFVGKVVDASGEPMPFASIRSLNNNIGTVADAQGRFMLRAPDSVLNVNVQSAGYATANVSIKSNRTVNNVVLNEDQQNLSEVVVTGMSNKDGSASRKKTDSTSLQPDGGWVNFKKYVNARVDSIRASSNMAYSNRDVELEFNVDKSGHPTDVKPTQQVDKELADKAIDILKQGPTWSKHAKKKRLRVRINL